MLLDSELRASLVFELELADDVAADAVAEGEAAGVGGDAMLMAVLFKIGWRVTL